MDAATWALLLLGVGLVLLFAEVFIPSGGLIGLAAGVAWIAAVVCAAQAWWSSHPLYFWLFLGSMSALIPSGLMLAFTIWPHTPLGRRAILHAPTHDEIQAFDEQAERLRLLIGRTGKTVTLLNPAGIVKIDNERLHCQSEGVIIELGREVTVVGARHNQVIVRETRFVEPSSEPTATGSVPDAVPPGAPSAEPTLASAGSLSDPLGEFPKQTEPPSAEGKKSSPQAPRHPEPPAKPNGATSPLPNLDFEFE